MLLCHMLDTFSAHAGCSHVASLMLSYYNADHYLILGPVLVATTSYHDRSWYPMLVRLLLLIGCDAVVVACFV
jgi:hypothetical protein